MKRDLFLKQLALKISGDLSAQQQQQFEQAIASNPEYGRIAEKLLKKIPAEETDNVTSSLEVIWHTIAEAEKHQVIENRPTHNINYLIRFAAAILLFIVAGLVWYKLTDNRSGGLIAMNTTDNKMYKTLDDGTIICLNRHTTVSYTANFGKYQREINMRGEAFFDVAKNAAVPLLIHTGNITITVKGTAFNVLEQQGQIDIDLIRGKIEVSGINGQSQSVPLAPHQRMYISAETYRVIPLDTLKQAVALQWTSDSLSFKKEKLFNLALLLEKKYRVKIEIRNDKLKTKRFSGVIKNERLTEALDALKLSYPFSYAIKNSIVIIK